MRYLIAMWIVLLFAASPAAAQTVTIDEFLLAVQRTHPFFDRERLQSEIDAKRRERYLGAEDWLIEASPSFTHRKPLRTTTFDPERVDFLELDAAASRVFWGNGSRVSLWWTSDVTDQDLPGIVIPGPGGDIEVPVGPSTFYRHSLNATWSLPLLKNRGGVLDRLEYELSRFDVDVSAVRAEENQEDFLLDVGLQFIDWVLIDEQMRIAQERLDLAEEELGRTRRKRAANLVNEADVLRAQDAVLVAQNARLLIDARHKSLQAELATIAGWEGFDGRNPDFDLYAQPALGDTETLIARARRNSRLLQSIDVQSAQVSRLESGYQESSRPELALNLTGSLRGGDDEFDRSLEINNPDVTVGLELRYPLGNRTATADIETARLQSRQLELARSDVTVTLDAGIRAIAVQVKALTDVLDGNARRIETAIQKTIEEKRLYDRGRGDLTFVIQSRDNEAVAKLAYAGNAALYHQLLLRYRALADELLPAENN